METRVDKTVQSFLDLIKRNYLPPTARSPAAVVVTAKPFGRPMEFGHRAMMYSLDVATSVAFGKAWGFLESDSDVNEYIAMSEKMLPTFGVLGTMPWLVYLMHAWPVNLLMPGEGDRVGFGCLIKWVIHSVEYFSTF